LKTEGKWGETGDALKHTPSALPTLNTPTPRHSLFREMEVLLHALSLYGAAGIAAFGWAVCRLLDWSVIPWIPLWSCAALLIYNADRLRPDPADLVNIPQRAASSIRWRGLSRVVCFGAAIFLVAWPIYSRDWLTLGLVLAGALVSLNYSIPIFGFRWKDIPLIKTFFAPTIVTAAILGLPWFHLGPSVGIGTFVLISLRAWTFLMFNMIICDLRDVVGDRACGIRSLPVALGEKGTRWLLGGLLVFIEILSITALSGAPARHRPTSWVICFLGPIYLGTLLYAIRRPRSERFYEWAVEGMLFLPAIAVLVGGQLISE
jgi:4-hydroxybenzoate polyprenyltransferase